MDIKTFKDNCNEIKINVTTWNNLLRKLIGTTWGANHQLLRTTLLALCSSASEYVSPLCSRTRHVKKIDVVLNETCCLITGCLKPTPSPLLTSTDLWY